MTISIDASKIQKTVELLGQVLYACKQGDRVQFLVDAGAGPAVVQRMRVALSRSRKRNESKGKKIDEFTLHHSVYPYTQQGKRHDCIVMWIEKNRHHHMRELLDDLVER